MKKEVADNDQDALKNLVLDELYYCHINGMKTPFIDEILEVRNINFDMKELTELIDELVSNGLIHKETHKISFVTNKIEPLVGFNVEDLIEEFCNKALGYIYLFNLTDLGIKHVRK